MRTSLKKTNRGAVQAFDKGNANVMKKNKPQCHTSMRQQIENAHMRMQMSSKNVIHNCVLMIAHFHQTTEK